MDYYSQFPAPDLNTAKREINTICKNHKYCNSYSLDELISEAFIHSKVLDKNNKIKYSLTGWYTFGKNDVMESIHIIIKLRKDKLRRKLRGLLRSTYLLIKTHKTSIEHLYHPNSDFVNNVLKTEFEDMAD